MTDEVKWLPGGKENVLRVYTDLHKHKLFSEHWAWVAVSRIAAGEPEAEVMADYGYHHASTLEPDGTCPDGLPCYRKVIRGGTPHNAIGQGSAACGASPAPTGCASNGRGSDD